MSQAAKVLLPFLASRGVRELDLLMVSHADQDHSGGYDDVVNHLPVQRRLGFRGEQCRHGERWQWGVAEFLVMNGPGWGDVDRNDRSCALLINWGDYSALLTGDVSRQREREWVRYWQHELRASLLLLPHHGSKTSTSHALLKWVRPNGRLRAVAGVTPLDIRTMRLWTGLRPLKTFNSLILPPTVRLL